MRRFLFPLGIQLILAGCRADPSPEQLRAMVAHNPDIVYEAFRDHPERFSALVRAGAAAADSARLEDALRRPMVPRIAHRAVLGDPSAPITIVEYSDFECPYCRAARPILVALMEAHAGHIRLVVKHTPLEGHTDAMPAALLFEAIARQNANAAYRFYDDVFEHQDRLRAEGSQFLRSAAARAGANVRRAVNDAESADVRAVIDSDVAEARSFGLEGTPCFLVNGVPIVGTQPLSTFERVITRSLESRRVGS